MDNVIDERQRDPVMLGQVTKLRAEATGNDLDGRLIIFIDLGGDTASSHGLPECDLRQQVLAQHL